ncbi:ORF16 [White sturgeon adenovirus 1]|uniref:ORF16 n=1 Tax=White sturgeon adenovirus 1 TaxID=2580388 RepID=A0A4V1F592_9ADEN|nr:ORF16 [White sturgeon adenovirus 1]QCQ84183.1 ORF16 [White sturgeon adenovirus 1]
MDEDYNEDLMANVPDPPDNSEEEDNGDFQQVLFESLVVNGIGHNPQRERSISPEVVFDKEENGVRVVVNSTLLIDVTGKCNGLCENEHRKYYPDMDELEKAFGGPLGRRNDIQFYTNDDRDFLMEEKLRRALSTLEADRTLSQIERGQKRARLVELKTIGIDMMKLMKEKLRDDPDDPDWNKVGRCVETEVICLEKFVKSVGNGAFMAMSQKRLVAITGPLLGVSGERFPVRVIVSACELSDSDPAPVVSEFIINPGDVIQGRVCYPNGKVE